MLIDAIKQLNRVLIICHIKPDGDCLGSGLALRYIAEQLGKPADIVVDSDVPEHYSFLKDYDKINVRTQKSYDLAIAVDCADEQRLGQYITQFKKAVLSINIDHHPTNNGYGKFNILQPKMSSTCEIVYDQIKNDFEVDENVAAWLFTGISTDTGNFMHNNTTAQTLRHAAELIDRGANLGFIITNLYRNTALRRVKLKADAIESLRFFEDGEISVITITKDMLKKNDCTVADTEGLIDNANNISGVKMAVCMTEQASKSYKVSFRSKGPDVASVAARFGGGGHKLASGCVVNGYYEDVLRKIVNALKLASETYDGTV